MISDLLLEYDEMIEHVRKFYSSRKIVEDAKEACLKKLEKYYTYFDFPAYYVCTILNPSTKMKLFNALGWKTEYIQLAKNTMKDVFESYARECGIKSPCDISSPEVDLSKFSAAKRRVWELCLESQSTEKTELDQYLDENIMLPDVQILDYWKVCIYK
jgi:hypothetical protein